MRTLILSDIHGNWHALEACLRQARGDYDLLVCLGDLVGYGAFPNEVVDWCRRSGALCIRGNHDMAAVGLVPLESFHDLARLGTLWTIQQLTRDHAQFLRDLPPGPQHLESFVVVHGSPRDEGEYLLDAIDAEAAFDATMHRLTFFGHTHLQGGFASLAKTAAGILPVSPHQQERVFPLNGGSQYLINPGSVGQPRDEDPRAAFAIYDAEFRTVIFRRAEYDLAAAQAAILDAGLPPFFASRLARGI